MNLHPARLLLAIVIAFLLGVVAASFLRFAVWMPAYAALVAFAALALLPRRALVIGCILLGFVGGIVRMQTFVPAPAGPPGVITANIYAARDWFLAGLHRALPEPYAAFVTGTLMGARSQLSSSIKRDFARTSTSHIIAVSGYNITIVINVVAWLALRAMRRSLAFWVCVAGLLVFVVMTGAQASVIRAAIMGLSGLLAQRVGRIGTPGHTLALTAGIMVALDPTILRSDIGFQLSFLATAGILFVSPLFDLWIPRVRYLDLLRETLIMTTSAQLCVVPLLIYYFKTFSVLSLPVNLIILPFIPYTMLSGFVAGMGGALVPSLARVIGSAALLLSYGVLAVIHFFSRISWSVITVELSWVSIFAMYVGLVMIWILVYRRGIHEES